MLHSKNYLLLFMLFLAMPAFAQNYSKKQTTQYSQASKFFNQKKYPQALKILAENLKLRPIHSPSLEMTGQIFKVRKQYDKAQRFYQASLKVSGHGNIIKLSSAGEVVDQLKKQKMPKLKPNTLNTILNLGVIETLLLASNGRKLSPTSLQQQYKSANKYFTLARYLRYRPELAQKGIQQLNKTYDLLTRSKKSTTAIAKVDDEEEEEEGEDGEVGPTTSSTSKSEDENLFTRFLWPEGHKKIMLSYLIWQERVDLIRDGSEPSQLYTNIQGLCPGLGWLRPWGIFEWGLEGCVLLGSSNVQNAPGSAVDYQQNGVGVVGLFLGPALYFRPLSQNTSFGAQTSLFYRKAAWEDPADGYEVDSKTKIGGALFLSGSWELTKKIGFSQKVGMGTGISSAIWLFQFSYLF